MSVLIIKGTAPRNESEETILPESRVCMEGEASLQMDFTSQLPVTSGHCTVWQKHGHNAGSEH